MLITFSGIDGAGKSTQIIILKKNLAQKGIKVKHIWARGGYTKGFEALKKILRFIFRKRLPKSGISEKRNKIIAKPWIAKLWIRIAIIDLILLWCIYVRVFKIMGFYILCDRYIEDTALDFKRNFNLIDVNKMLLWRFLVKFAPKPNHAFLFLIPLRVSLERSLKKNEPFPDDEETLRWRLQQYNNKTLFSETNFKIINGEDEINYTESIVKKEIFN